MRGSELLPCLTLTVIKHKDYPVLPIHITDIMEGITAWNPGGCHPTLFKLNLLYLWIQAARECQTLN